MSRLHWVVALAIALPAASFAQTERQNSNAPNQLTFRVKSNHANKVQIAYYSQTRRGHAWPGGSQVYSLNDYNVHTHTLTCSPGEKICYGAWVTGSGSKYWGVGPNNRYGCTSCCSTCGAGTVTYNLNP